MSDKQTDSLDQIFEAFDKDIFTPSESSQRQAITIWVPEQYKAKFDSLQDRTNRRFGKLVKAMLMKSIDRIEPEANA